MIRHVVMAGGLALAAALPASAEPVPAPALSLDLGALTPADLGALAAGTPLVIEHTEATGGGSAMHTITTAPNGHVTIRSRAEASAVVGGAPVTLSGGGQFSTGGMGDITMASDAGVAGMQLASGVGNVQQNSVSVAFVLTGLPSF